MSKDSVTRVRNRIFSYLEIFKTKSFVKFFFSLFFLVIFPLTVFITHFLYQNYQETLDWNYRFQLTRVQLMSIDLENHIRDQLLTQSIHKTHFWKGDLNSLKNSKEFQNCLFLEESRNFPASQKTYFFPCNYQDKPKNWILYSDSGMLWIYSAEFLEDLLLDSPFSESYESIFLLNANGRFGISSQIESEFRVPEQWSQVLLAYSEERASLPKIREVEIENKVFYLSSFPMYGLPFHLFVISPKDTILEPIRISLVRNLLFLFSLLLVSLLFSAWISAREIEDKRKLSIVFREFPHAAFLFDAEGNELLRNPYLENKTSLSSLYIHGVPVLKKIQQEAESFLFQVREIEKVAAKTRIEEWETLTKEGDLIILEVALHLWFLENQQNVPRGTLVLVQDITSKKLEFQTEMVYARNLQKKYLPSEKINIPKLQYDFAYLPLLQVGGDYYDFLNLENNRFIFVLGDIVGHGVHAAMMMTVVRVLLHQIVKDTSDPSEILLKMNEGVRTNLPDSYSFVPFHFLLFDFDKNKIYYGNAGHPGVVHIRKNGETQIPEKLNPMLGMLPTFSPKILEIDLCSGDRFFLFTDGLADVRNNTNESMGYDDLVLFFQNSAKKDIFQIKDVLTEKIKNHSQGATFPDDITWIGIEII